MVRSYLTLAVFGSILTLVAAILYIGARLDVPTSMPEVGRAIALGMFFVNFPFQLLFLKRLQKIHPAVVIAAGFIFELLLSGLLALSPLSGSGIILLIMMVAGCWWAVKNVVEWWPEKSVGHQLSVLTLFAGISGWLILTAWNNHMISPLFWERLATSQMHGDTLFHMSITNMIKNYHHISTGADGLVQLQYHVGSHVIYAGLMEAFNLETILFYNLSAPLLNLSLLIIAVGLAAAYIQERLKIHPLSLTSFFPWLIVLLSLISIFPHALLNQIGVAPFYLLSESHALATALTLFAIPLIGETYRLCMQKITTKNVVLTAVAVIGLGACFLGIGFVKLSHLYLILGVCWYLWLRLKVFKRVIPTLGLMVTTFLAFVLLQHIRLADHQALWQPGHYLHQVINSQLKVLWLVLGLSALWMYVAARLLSTKPKNLRYLLQSISKQSYLDVEIVVVSTVVGLIPALLLNLGPNGNYFIDAHRWLALTFFISVSPQLVNQWQKYRMRFKAALTGAVLLVMCILCFRNIQQQILLYMHDLETTKAAMFSTYGSLDLAFATSNKDRANLFEYLHVLSRSPDSQTALYFPRNSIFWNMPADCVPLSLLPQAVSGSVALDSLPATWCDYELFAYRTYDKQGPSLSRPNDQQLCEYAQARSFNKVIVLTTEPRPLNCK